MEKLLLVDGNSILNRGFFGLPLLSNSDGIYTNAVLGFMNITLKVITDEKPDYLVVAFDVHAPTFRHKMFEAYKGTRKPMPSELKMQLPVIREVLKAMKVSVVEMAGYEADDILGTLAKRYQKEGFEVTLLSGDRDLLQISDEHIKISIPKTTKGKTETFNYYPQDVINEYGVTPLQFIDVKALMGDSSDNIPGVTKVGQKTATDLIVKYGGLDGVYENIEDQKGKLKENLVNDKDVAYLSKTLATIDINAPVKLNIEDAACKNYLNADSIEVFKKYSLKSVLTKLESMDFGSADSVAEYKNFEIDYSVISDLSEAEDLFLRLEKAPKASVYSDGTNGIAVMISGDENPVYISFEGFLTFDYVADKLKKAVALIDKLITWSVKDSYNILGEYRDNLYDVEIIEYLLDPLKGSYPATYLAEKYLNAFFSDEKDFASDNVRFSSFCAYTSLLVFDELYEKLCDANMEKLFRNIEMPLSFVLYSMQKEGILANREQLKLFSEELSVSIDNLEKEIHQDAGMEFNISSPKQLGDVLFDKLKLPYGKKTKTGYSTSADVLEKLAPEAPIVKKVLEYRTLTKLKSTYADALVTFIGEDGRIHANFNQTVTATGRISSSEPNLQNIPIKTQLGRELRKVFYAKEGFSFVDADYSQIELRLMAHMSGDMKLIDAYRNNKDIHRSTAAKVFHVPFEEVTDVQRRNAKAVNFGIIYGISSYGLSQDLSISVSDAKKYINDYFEEFPDVKKFLDKVVSDAKESLKTKTLFDRVRPIPELGSSNFMQRSFGERVAMNAPIQGTAADIMKIAMINIFNRLSKECPKSKLLIQVHDEVLVEASDDEISDVITIISEEMAHAAELSVNLEVDVHSGKNWYEAK